jgi:hypothetical protein
MTSRARSRHLAASWTAAAVCALTLVVGSKDTVAVGNGYGDWNADWAQWRAGSALR